MVNYWVLLLRIVLAFSLLEASLDGLRAQSSEVYIFHHTSSGTSYVVQPNDRLRIWAADGTGHVWKHTGRLLRIENDLIYLKRQPAIPLDRVQKIKYHPRPVRNATLVMMIMGWLLLCGAFVAGLAALASDKAEEVAGWLLGLGFGLFFLCLPLNILTVRRMKNVHTEWKVEVVPQRPAPMLPVP